MQFSVIGQYANKLTEARTAIVTEWIDHHDVQSIFKRHGISSDYFKSQFAYAIFDYYMGVIKGVKEIGDCPIMGAYLDFLNYNHVTPDEVFMVCTHFRKSLVAFIFSQGIASHELINELSLIADRNLQGVLKRFNVIYKEDEESLLQQRQSLLEAQKIAKIGHWELDLRSDSLYWSDEVCRIFGIEPHTFDATYEAFLERIHPDDVDMVNHAYKDSVENRTDYHVVHRIFTVNNVLKYVEERCSHNFDKDGNVYRSIGTVHDITDKINAQKELQLASQLFKHSSDAVVITDENNHIVMANETFTNLTGYSIEEIKGKNPRLFSAGWGNRAFYDQMWSEIIEQGVWHGEIWDRKKSGETYAAGMTILNVKDNDGNTTNYIGISSDVTAKKEQEKQIRQLAYYDTLTKLPNRLLFRNEIDAYIESSNPDETKFAIFLMDIDNFKWINDSMGHTAGNEALIEVTKRVQNILGGTALLSRMGGDEFAIFYPYKHTREVSQQANKVIACFKTPISIEKKDISLGLSIGISLYPDNASDYGALIQAADTAMYDAKEHGKNHFVYFNQKMNENVVKRLDIDTQLRQAIKNESFTMVYQPKVSLSSKEVYGLEALVRWNDFKLGFVPPDVFIPIAEESRLIDEIGYWVIQKSLEEFKEILDKSERDLIISINVSGKQLNDRKFVRKLADILDISEVQPENIEFEITETAIMDNIEIITQTLHDIKTLGISISIDDFGTGYSSMAYLKKLPIQTIKIDRAFVKDITIDEDDRAIVEAIVAMSRQLNLMTIAEGIETQEHAEILCAMGVNNGQGYLYSKPISRDEFIAFIGQ
ncbi:MAG: EAL domain-containing protein [Campylobacterota bacterium]|nr:EAL domain-containing protein [Campylobacterota bacterium]